jgi:lichenan operon transcriptional antiterminator
MESGHLSLRQKKLLNFLQSQTAFIISAELAKFLHVSPRTIRNDIAEINQELSKSEIQIISKKRKGYRLIAENQEVLQQFKQTNSPFLTREDRVRYLAFQLCLADIPINIYDLEDEMYVSHTTLEHDLHLLKVKYVISAPHIKLIQTKGFLGFEPNEKKRRSILNHLFHEDWNYNAKGNAYYQYQYLDEQTMDLIMREVPKCLNRYAIQLEDTNLVTLNLAIAIMYHRIQSGHKLQESFTIVLSDRSAELAVEELLNTLEQQLNCSFSPAERNEIYLHVAYTRLMDASKLNFATVDNYFSLETIQIADAYLQKIHQVFQIILAEDEDFYITLLQYIRYLQAPTHNFNKFQLNPDIVRVNMMIEYEIAYLFQDFALEYLDYYLDQTELMYLALCISGALEYLNLTACAKFKAVICCHLNLYATWAIKRNVLAAFGNFLDIIAILPVNAKTVYDFSKVDLVLTTVNKSITNCPNTKVMYISPFMSQTDYLNLEHYISKKRLERLCAPALPSTSRLLRDAYWHELIPETDKLAIIELLISDFIDHQLVPTDYYEDLMRRESISTFAFQPGIVFMFSLKPSAKTCLSVATLEHRIIWNSYKIRTVIMAAIHPNDATLIFSLINDIYHNDYDLTIINHLKTKKEILEYLRQKV